MIHIKLPEFEALEKIRIRLDAPRKIVFKDGRKSNPSQTTTLVKDFNKHSGREGVYIMCKGGKVGYIGATTDFFLRMNSHIYLKNNLGVKHVFFLEEKNKSKRLLFEMIYKYHYFGKVNVEWNFAKWKI